MASTDNTNHPVGAGTGAVAGTVTGAVIGAAAGPIGAAIGALVGGLGGAKTGEAAAEFVNPTVYDDHWRNTYTTRPYYKADRSWDDYGPAYSLGYHARHRYQTSPFDDVESDLERTWEKAKHKSRLAWQDAKEAVRDGWNHVERAIPGDSDNDGH